MAFPLNMRAAFGVSSPSALPPGDSVDRFMTTILPTIRANRSADVNQELANKIKLMQAQSDIASKMKPAGMPMNVSAGMSPYEQARIALMGAQEKGKTTRETAALDTKKEIAGQTEAGRSERAQLRSDTSKGISDDKLKLGMKQLGLKEDQFNYYKKLHNMSDEDKLKLVQSGKLSMEDLKNSHALEQIGARGDVDISNIQERGKQQRTTQGAKPLTPQQQGAQYENKAREILSAHPEYKDYFDFNQDTNKLRSIKNGGNDEVFHNINKQIYGTPTPGEDISLPAENKPQTYNQGDDPLGLFGGNSNNVGDNEAA